MVIILKRNLQEKSDLIKNQVEYRLLDSEIEEAYINFIAYLRVYISKEGKDLFIRKLVEKSEFEDYVRALKN